MTTPTSNLLSFIIPVKNEQDSLKLIFNEIKDVVENLKRDFEVIFVDDGSNDQTFVSLEQLQKENSKIKVIKLRGNFGKSIALQVGFENARGDIIFTLDGDLQDNPSEIPHFLDELAKGYDLVSGWKKKRYDPLTKTIPSKIINWLARVLTGVPIHDTNCGFKAYRRELTDSLNLYGELYRFIPIFAAKDNYRVGEIVVEHRKRRFGKSKFGWDRGVKGVLDLLTVIFLTGYLRRPGHFFGSLGLLSFGSGFVIGLYISYIRFTTGTIQYRTPLLFLGMLLMIIGIQLITTGLLAELMINQTKRDTKNYIAKVLS